MLTVVPSGEHCAELGPPVPAAKGGSPVYIRGGFQDWLEDVVCRRLVDRTRKPSGALGLAQRLLSFAELNDFIATIEPDTRPHQLAALARALDSRGSSTWTW